MITKIDKLLYDKNLGKFFANIDGQIVEVKTGSGEGGSISIDGAVTPNSTHAVSGKTVYDAIQAAVQDLKVQIEEHSVDPESVTPTVTQTTSSTQSGGDNIITFTFPNGETTNIVIKNGAQGEQGNSGVASADEVVVVNNLTEGGTTVTEGGVTKVKVLSAEMGKELKTQAFVEKGTFAQAYIKANNTNAVFPWLMTDEDSQGNQITKMIWHTGDKHFVDAIGSIIEGFKTGFVVTAVKNGVIRVYKDSTVYKDLPLYVGDNMLHFDDLLVDANDAYDDILHPKRNTISFGVYETANDASTFVKDDTIVTDIDFAGLALNGSELFMNNTTLKTIKNISVYDNLMSFCKGCSSLSYIKVSGGSPNSRLNWSNTTFNYCSNLTYLYGAGLYPNNIRLWTNGATPTLVDLRDANFSLANNDVFQGSSNIETVILGKLDLGIDANSWFNIAGGNVTNLVYMNDTPPTLTSGGVNETWLKGSRVTNIYVPANSVTAYQTAWSGVTSSKIKGYTEVNGKIVFES